MWSMNLKDKKICTWYKTFKVESFFLKQINNAFAFLFFISHTVQKQEKEKDEK